MRLNLDCLRDILLCVEEVADYRRPAMFVDTDAVNRIGDHLGDHPKPPPYQQEFLHAYESNEILYHLRYCLRQSCRRSPFPLFRKSLPLSSARSFKLT